MSAQGAWHFSYPRFLSALPACRARNTYGYLRDLIVRGTRVVPVLVLVRHSLAHCEQRDRRHVTCAPRPQCTLLAPARCISCCCVVLILLRNADRGCGSLTSSTTSNGHTPFEVQSSVIPIAAAQSLVSSQHVAAVTTLLARMVANPASGLGTMPLPRRSPCLPRVPMAEFEAAAPLAGLLSTAMCQRIAPGAWGEADAAAQSTPVAEGAAAPVNAAVLGALWNEDSMLMLDECTHNLVAAAATARAWFDTPRRAMLPSLSAQSLYRVVMLCDIDARLSSRVFCSLGAEDCLTRLGEGLRHLLLMHNGLAFILYVVVAAT